MSLILKTELNVLSDCYDVSIVDAKDMRFAIKRKEFHSDCLLTQSNYVTSSQR